jgi:hypothetical protein
LVTSESLLLGTSETALLGTINTPLLHTLETPYCSTLLIMELPPPCPRQVCTAFGRLLADYVLLHKAVAKLTLVLLGLFAGLYKVSGSAHIRSPIPRAVL